jgi:hypothetical protein
MICAVLTQSFHLRHRATEISDGPHFDLRTVRKDRTGFGDLDRSCHGIHSEQELACDGFF